MAFLIDDVLSGTPNADLNTDGATTFVRITAQGLVFTANGTVRNAGSLSSAYYNSAVVPPALYRVIGVVSAMGTLITGAQAGISGRVVSGASTTTQDRHSVIVNPADTTGNTTKLILRAIGTTGTVTNLVQYTVPSWGASIDRTVVLGLGIANTQVVYLDGAPVLCAFDTSVTRAGRGGIDYGNASQGAGAVGYQLTEWMVDDLTDAPTWSVAPTITPGNPAQGVAQTCNPGTMSGGDTTKFQWMSQDTSGTGTNFTAISGATSATFTPTGTEVGKKLICVVMRQTGASTPGTLLTVGSNVTAQTAAVTGPPPANGASPSIAWQTGTDPQAVGGVIVITPGTETNTPTSQTITVQRNLGLGWVTIATFGPSAYPLATQNYTTVSGDAGAQIRVQETASNAGGSSSASTSNILNVSALALTTANLHWRLSGGVGNTNPLLAIGGAMSTTDAGSGLFDPISGSVALAGLTDYRLVYLYNDHPSASGDVFAYLTAQFSQGGEGLDIGWAAEGQNVDVAPPVDRFTAPVGVAFSRPATLGAGLHAGTLGPNSRRGLWLRRTIPTGAPPFSGDTATVRGDVAPL